MRPEIRKIVCASVGFALLAGLAGCASPTREFVRVEIPGTRLTLEVPDGFVVSKQFPGLVNPAARASVMVTEIPYPAEEVRAGMSEHALAARDARLLGSESVDIDGRQAWLFHVAGGPADREVHRFILVIGEGGASAVLSASAPQSQLEILEPQLRDTLLGAGWDADRVLGPWSGMGFRLDEGKTLKISDRLPQMVAMTKGGHRGALSPKQPLFLAGRSFAASAISDLTVFANEQLRMTAEITHVAVTSEELFAVDGLPAIEIVAEATDGGSGTPLRVYQLLVVAVEKYFLLQGMVGAEAADEYLAEFREIALSFRRIP